MRVSHIKVYVVAYLQCAYHGLGTTGLESHLGLADTAMQRLAIWVCVVSFVSCYSCKCNPL